MPVTSKPRGGGTTPPQPQSGERRRRPRVAGATQGWLIPDTGDTSDPWEVRIANVSRHGVGFESSVRLDRDQIVRIRIGRGPLHLSRRVRIVNCRAARDRGTFIIGGEFVNE